MRRMISIRIASMPMNSVADMVTRPFGSSKRGRSGVPSEPSLRHSASASETKAHISGSGSSRSAFDVTTIKSVPGNIACTSSKRCICSSIEVPHASLSSIKKRTREPMCSNAAIACNSMVFRAVLGRSSRPGVSTIWYCKRRWVKCPTWICLVVKG